jgi:fructose-bisphosphate aldolase class II
MASTGAVPRFLAENSAEFDPRKFLKATIVVMSDICIARHEMCSCAGNANKTKPINLEWMYELYDTRVLNPTVK